MSDHASRLEVEYVPVNLRNDGMIAAREGAPCPQINFVKYVLATDYAQANMGRTDPAAEGGAVMHRQDLRTLAAAWIIAILIGIYTMLHITLALSAAALIFILWLDLRLSE